MSTGKALQKSPDGKEIDQLSPTQETEAHTKSHNATKQSHQVLF